MITIHTQNYGLKVILHDEFTLQDFQKLEEALLQTNDLQHLPDLLLDLSALKDFTVDMAFEHLRFLRKHARHFGRTAVVVSDIWIRLGTHVANLFTLYHPKYFNDVDSAEKWLQQSTTKSKSIV